MDEWPALRSSDGRHWEFGILGVADPHQTRACDGPVYRRSFCLTSKVFSWKRWGQTHRCSMLSIGIIFTVLCCKCVVLRGRDAGAELAGQCGGLWASFLDPGRSATSAVDPLQNTGVGFVLRTLFHLFRSSTCLEIDAESLNLSRFGLLFSS